jgi:hypothetical protein
LIEEGVGSWAWWELLCIIINENLLDISFYRHFHRSHSVQVSSQVRVNSSDIHSDTLKFFSKEFIEVKDIVGAVGGSQKVIDVDTDHNQLSAIKVEDTTTFTIHDEIVFKDGVLEAFIPQL